MSDPLLRTSSMAAPLGASGDQNANGRSSLAVRQFLLYRIRLPLTIFATLLGLSLAVLSKPFVAIGSWTDHWIDIIGFLLVAGGVLTRLWSISTISSMKTVHLVKSGPYAMCRNPLYVGTLLIVVGFLCLIQSLTSAVCLMPIVLLYVFGIVPIEEKVLQAHHGEDFAAYCKSTPRWVPMSFGFPKTLSFNLKDRAIRREFESALWWVAIALAVHSIFDLHATSMWRSFLNLP